MGIRLEFILIIVLVITIGITTTVKLTNTKYKAHQSTKELEFIDTTFIEVDREKMQARSFSTHGVRDAGVLRLEHLTYHTGNIELLLADLGTYKKNILYLDGNVSLQEKEGSIYTTEHAKYNQKTEILNITSAFTAQVNKSVIKGNSLEYKAISKEVKATRVDAVVYTTKK